MPGLRWARRSIFIAGCGCITAGALAGTLVNHPNQVLAQTLGLVGVALTIGSVITRNVSRRQQSRKGES